MEYFFFPYIGNAIIPIDFHIFQRGRYTTNQIGSWLGEIYFETKRTKHIRGYAYKPKSQGRQMMPDEIVTAFHGPGSDYAALW